MANELTKRYDESSGHGGVIQDYTISDSASIEKGTLLGLDDPRTASGTIVQEGACCGVAAREKVANDGRTQISVYKKGYFDALASGAIACGAAVMAAGDANYVMQADMATEISGASIIGYSEETASDDETFVLRLDL